LEDSNHKRASLEGDSWQQSLRLLAKIIAQAIFNRELDKHYTGSSLSTLHDVCMRDEDVPRSGRSRVTGTRSDKSS
jgi:hypothetical protein